MIKYKQDLNVISRQNVMGGAGSFAYTEMFSKEECPKTRVFGCNTMEPGGTTGSDRSRSNSGVGNAGQGNGMY